MGPAAAQTNQKASEMKCIATIILFIAHLAMVGCSANRRINSVCEAEKTHVEVGGSQNERLPLGLAQMPGSKMRTPVILDGSRMGSGISISAEMEVPGQMKDIGDFYMREFRRVGARIEYSEYYKDTILLSGATKDGGFLMMGIDKGKWSGVPNGSAKVDVHYQADCL